MVIPSVGQDILSSITISLFHSLSVFTKIFCFSWPIQNCVCVSYVDQSLLSNVNQKGLTFKHYYDYCNNNNDMKEKGFEEKEENKNLVSGWPMNDQRSKKKIEPNELDEWVDQ